jgi:putative isomerase
MRKSLMLPSSLIFALSSVHGQTTPALVALPASLAGGPAVESAEYHRVQERLQRGWNTWDTSTIAGQVLLPQALEIRLGLKRNRTINGDAFLPDILIGRQGANDEQVRPGPHTYDGSYTSFEVTWAGAKVTVQTAHAGDDLVMLVTPNHLNPEDRLPISAVFSVGFLWNRPGHVARETGRILATAPGKDISIYLTGKDSGDPYIPLQSPFFSADLTEPVGISTGKPRTLQEVRNIINQELQTYTKSLEKNPQLSSVLNAIETIVAWDTIYEPGGRRVITPVSRLWNMGWGGYVLFDWDTFFAADLAAAGSRDLACANVLEILNEVTPEGFVPNYGRPGNWKSFDRSEPPVGAITVLGLYRKYHQRWLLKDSFDRLLKWNRWWTEHRDLQGYLVWGTDGQNQPANLDDHSAGTLQGAKYESGIDNGPQFDGATYNAASHTMEFADVGLMGLYIADANALAVIADILGKDADSKWLHDSAVKYQKNLATLWDPKAGIFLNKDLHTGAFSYRLSPTNFYPLLAKAATPQQADAMLTKHLLNPDEFWGDRVLPAIARNDPAFQDQEYWRGRIWGPMIYLVYQGLLNYDTPIAIQARRELAGKSAALFRKEWEGKGHVHENYSAISDDSDTSRSSDRFYHWGALLGLIEYEEMTRPERTSQEK